MPAIFFKAVIALALLFGAIHTLVSLRRQRSKEWEEILNGIVQPGVRLSQLSYDSIFSSGMECPIDEVCERIDGPRGVWAIFKNAGIFLEAMTYVETHGESNRRLQQTIGQLREEARRLRFIALLVFLRCLVTSRHKGVSLAVGETARAYTALVSQLSLAINDHCPELMIHYRFFVVQS